MTTTWIDKTSPMVSGMLMGVLCELERPCSDACNIKKVAPIGKRNYTRQVFRLHVYLLLCLGRHTSHKIAATTANVAAAACVNVTIYLFSLASVQSVVAVWKWCKTLNLVLSPAIRIQSCARKHIISLHIYKIRTIYASRTRVLFMFTMLHHQLQLISNERAPAHKRIARLLLLQLLQLHSSARASMCFVQQAKTNSLLKFHNPFISIHLFILSFSFSFCLSLSVSVCLVRSSAGLDKASKQNYTTYR